MRFGQERGLEMGDIRLISSRDRELRPLVAAALENELRIIHAGIKRTAQRLKDFESKYELRSSEFFRRYENDELAESLDFAEWIGEIRMLERLKEKSETLKDIRIEN